MSFNSHKRDIVEEAQLVLNANKSLENKNLISGLANEIIAHRMEIERLEGKIVSLQSPDIIKSVIVVFDRDGKVDGVEVKKYG